MIKQHPTLPIKLNSETGEVFMPEVLIPHKPARWTKGSKTSQGYRRVTIDKKEYRVHRLMAETFLVNTENKPTVDHINRVRDDNRLVNLRYADYHEQIENGRALGRVDYGVRSCENQAKYDAARYKAIKADPDKWKKYRERRIAWEIRTGRRKCSVVS